MIKSNDKDKKTSDNSYYCNYFFVFLFSFNLRFHVLGNKDKTEYFPLLI